MNLLKIIVSEDSEKRKGKRVDQFLSAYAGLPSRSQLKAWFQEGRITRRGIQLSPSDFVYAGDELLVAPPKPKKLELEARPMDLKIFYEDSNLIVLYKPRGISMHPGASTDASTTLVHALLAHSEKLSSLGEEFRPGIVHRLDKDTEGIVVVAKDNETHEGLSKQFAERSVVRSYWALCLGRFPSYLEVNASIGRHPTHRKKMAVVSKGRASRSEFFLVDHFSDGYSLVRCKLHSGRTHQIRVHLAHKSFPVLNDPLYGRAWKKILRQITPAKLKTLENLTGQALVAYELGFVHPVSKEALHFQAEMPDWLKCLTMKSQ